MAQPVAKNEMDFIQGLKEAEAIGISRQQFMKVWEHETKMKQLEDELQLQQRRAEAGKIENCKESLHATSLLVEAQFQKFSIDQRRALNNLKEDLQQQNQALIADISRLLEGFASLVGRVIKDELQTALAELSLSESNTSRSSNLSNSSQVPQGSRHSDQGSTRIWSKVHEESESIGESSISLDHNSANDLISETNVKKGKKKRGRRGKRKQKNALTEEENAEDQPSNHQKNIEQDTSRKPLNSFINSGDDSSSCNSLLLPKDEPVKMLVFGISQVAECGKISKSPVYHLQDSSFKVQLSLWFDSEKELKMNLTFWGLSLHPLKSSRVFIISGEIKNKNSSAYSSLFSQISPMLSLQKPWSQNVELPLVLKTKRGSYSNINLETLYTRNFVFEEGDSIAINWLVMSKEA